MCNKSQDFKKRTELDRHKIEYEIVPECMYSERATDFVSTVLMKKQYLFLEMYQRLNADMTGYLCPYLPDDFGVDAVLIRNMAGILRITMPPILEPGDIVRMYICHNDALEKARLYTVRIDCDGDTCFMTWVDNEHYINHGKFKLREEDEMKTVVNFYMKYLSKTKDH